MRRDDICVLSYEGGREGRGVCVCVVRDEINLSCALHEIRYDAMWNEV